MSREYFNSRACIWDKKIAEKDVARLEALAKRLDIEPGSTMLDVGTGTGIFIPFLLKKLGSEGKLVCLDFAEEMLKVARTKDFKGNIEYICRDIEQTAFEDMSFDAVVCYSSFPHFKNKLKALKEIHRLMKREGKLYICHSSSRAAINIMHRHLPDVSNDLIPAEAEMHSLLETAGFKDIVIRDEPETYLAFGTLPLRS